MKSAPLLLSVPLPGAAFALLACTTEPVYSAARPTSSVELRAALAPVAPEAAPLTIELRNLSDYRSASMLVTRMNDGALPLQPMVVKIVDPVGLPDVMQFGDPFFEGQPLDITLDGGGHCLRRTQFFLSGRRVVVRDLRLEVERRPMQALVVDASESIELQRLSVIGAASAPTNRGSQRQVGSIVLFASGPAVRVKATGVSVLDAGAPGTVSLERQGPGGFGEVDWLDGRFGGNVDPALVTGRVTLLRARGTRHLGPGELLRALPATLLLEDWTDEPESESTLEEWRRAARGEAPDPR